MLGSACWWKPDRTVFWEVLQSLTNTEVDALSQPLDWAGWGWGSPDGGVGLGTEGAEGVCSPMEGATVSTGQAPQRCWGLDLQPKCTQGGTHSSCYICGRGWPCCFSLNKNLNSKVYVDSNPKLRAECCEVLWVIHWKLKQFQMRIIFRIGECVFLCGVSL